MNKNTKLAIANLAIKQGGDYIFSRLVFEQGASLSEEALLRCCVGIPTTRVRNLLKLEGYSVVESGYPNHAGEYDYRIRRSFDARRMVRQGVIGPDRIW